MHEKNEYLERTAETGRVMRTADTVIESNPRASLGQINNGSGKCRRKTRSYRHCTADRQKWEIISRELPFFWDRRSGGESFRRNWCTEWRTRNETRKEERKTRGGKSEGGVLAGRHKLVGPSSDKPPSGGLWAWGGCLTNMYGCTPAKWRCCPCPVPILITILFSYRFLIKWLIL